MKSNPEHPGWLEISIHIHPVAHEALSAFLFDLGCEGIVSGDNSENVLKAFLPFRKDSEDIRNRIDIFLTNLKEIFQEIPSPTLVLDRIEDHKNYGFCEQEVLYQQEWSCLIIRKNDTEVIN